MKKCVEDPLSFLRSFNLNELRINVFSSIRPKTEETEKEKENEDKHAKKSIVILDQSPRDRSFYQSYFPNSNLLFFNQANAALKRIKYGLEYGNVDQVIIDDSLSEVPAPILISLIKKIATNLNKEIVILVTYTKKIDLKKYNPKPDMIMEKETGHIEIIS